MASPKRTPSRSGTPGSARRTPAPAQRQRDAERSRERLLAAALDEFSVHGYAGARVSAIADRAGLNQQLIAYYFGGKEGLYRALEQRWLEQEEAIARPDVTLDELLAGYAAAAFADPRGSRLLLWTGLTDQAGPDARPAGIVDREDLSDFHRRQANGEIAPDLEPDMLQLALMGAALAPIAIPQVVRRLTGQNVDDPEFQARYTEQLRRIAAHLAGSDQEDR
jgi:TetR/AcrR family transcriptional regulator